MDKRVLGTVFAAVIVFAASSCTKSEEPAKPDTQAAAPAAKAPAPAPAAPAAPPPQPEAAPET